jgi:hypothetical protein
MPEERTSRPDDRPPAGLSAGLLIVAAVIVVHLFFALLIGLGPDEPALADPGPTGPAAACVGDATGAGATGACVAPASPAPSDAVTPSATAEPAAGGRGSY